MSTVIVTGAHGLVGSESVKHFSKLGYDVVGIDNDMRAHFFGPEASTKWQEVRLGLACLLMTCLSIGRALMKAGKPKVTNHRRIPLWAVALVGLSSYGLVLLTQPADLTERLLLGRNDFIQLYAGAKLSGSGLLYDRAASEQIQRRAAGFDSTALMHFRPEGQDEEGG